MNILPKVRMKIGVLEQKMVENKIFEKYSSVSSFEFSAQTLILL